MIVRGTLYSESLNMDTGISIITPKKVDKQKDAKVVYLLHGLVGNSQTWLDYTMLAVYAEKYEYVFVMPEVSRSFYMNMAHGMNYFDYVCWELPKIMDNQFNLTSKKEDRFIMGASMGGYGALKCGLTRPDYFGNIGAFSSALLPLGSILQAQEDGEAKKIEELFPDDMVRDFKGIFGEDLHYQEEIDVVALATKVPEIQRPNVYLSCGTNDSLLGDNQVFAKKLGDLGWKIELDEWQGNHDWKFFDESLEQALRWYRRLK